MKTSKYVGIVTVTLAAALAHAGWKASELFSYYPNSQEADSGYLSVKGDFAAALYKTLAKSPELKPRGGRQILGDLEVTSHKSNPEYSCSEGRTQNDTQYECGIQVTDVTHGEITVTGLAAETFFNEMVDVGGDHQRAGDGFSCTRDTAADGKPDVKCQITVSAVTH